jgi:hypothetical protein
MMSSLLGFSGRPLLRVLVGAVGVVLPDIALASTYLLTWLVPGALGDDIVRTLVTTLLLEFFVIHSAAFMGVAAVAPFPRGLRAVIVAGLGAVYMVILWPMSQITGQTWMVWAFWGLVLNRLWALAAPAVATGLHSSQPVQNEWAMTGALYVGLAAVTSFLPVPALGLGAGGVWQRPPGGGLWMDAPQHAMAMGLFYFGGNAYARLRR